MTPIQLDLDWKKSLLVDLDVIPSTLFVKDDPKPVEGEEAAAEEESENFIPIKWLCKPGLPASISLIKKEFENARGLRPIKIVVTGPPCSGKSFYSEQLASHYNVPHIHMKKLLDDLMSWDQEKEDRYNVAKKIRDDKVAVI